MDINYIYWNEKFDISREKRKYDEHYLSIRTLYFTILNRLKVYIYKLLSSLVY